MTPANVNADAIRNVRNITSISFFYGIATDNRFVNIVKNLELLLLIIILLVRLSECWWMRLGLISHSQMFWSVWLYDQ